MRASGAVRLVAAAAALTSCGREPAPPLPPPRPAPAVTAVARVHLVEEAPRERAYTLPVPTTAVEPRGLAAPHHDYPASDLMVPVGTPVFAAHAGRATLHGGPRCGHGVTLAGEDGFRYVYCHLAGVAVEEGDEVRSGDVLGLSGDTGNARGVPHLHFHVRDADGRLVCPQGALLAWYAGRDASPRAADLGRPCAFPRDGAAR